MNAARTWELSFDLVCMLDRRVIGAAVVVVVVVVAVWFSSTSLLENKSL